MDDKLQKFLEGMGEKSQEAWAVLAAEQAIWNANMVYICLACALLIGILGTIGVIVAIKLRNEYDDWLGIVIGALFTLLFTGLSLVSAADNYLDSKVPNKTLFEKVIGAEKE